MWSIAFRGAQPEHSSIVFPCQVFHASLASVHSDNRLHQLIPQFTRTSAQGAHLHTPAAHPEVEEAVRIAADPDNPLAAAVRSLPAAADCSPPVAGHIDLEGAERHIDPAEVGHTVLGGEVLRIDLEVEQRSSVANIRRWVVKTVRLECRPMSR